MDGPRVVFERPRFSKRAVNALIAVVIVLGFGFFAPMPDNLRALAGGLAVAIGPIVLFVWFRVGQRIELSADGITVAGRVAERHYAWPQFAAKKVRFPAYNWNDQELVAPRELSDVEPLFAMKPPPRAGECTELEYVTFERIGDSDRFAFHLLEGLCLIRGSDPGGDWARQAATIFTARAQYGFGPRVAVPAARIVE